SGLLVAAGLIAAAADVSAQTSLTIYNDGRILARRTLPVTVPQGTSQHRLALGTLEPGTVFTLDQAITILGSQFDAAVDDQNTMRRAVGRRILFRHPTSGDTTRVTVLGVDPERFQFPDGSVGFARPGQPLYPADLVLIDPTLTLSIRSSAARSSLGLGWFTGGGGWQAHYAVTLDGASARVAGHAAINAGPLSLDSVEVQVLAGSVGRASQPMMRQLASRGEVMAMAAEMDVAQSEQVGEAYLYTIPGRLTLRPGVVTTVALFEPATAPVERNYVVHSGLPFRGAIGQYGDMGETPVAVSYTLKRPVRTPFGDLAVPGGVVRLYQRDEAGRAQLIGEGAVRHTAPGQDLRVDAGSAFDLTARRVQTTYTTRRDSLRTIMLADYEVTIANAKDSTVTVDVLEERAGEWRVIQSSVTAERISSTRTRFRVRVPPQGQVVVTYRIEARW
ncbi:MAG: DUF4139 domain-containing protein, partial [Gemmatimonadales bacterium]